MSNFRRSPKSPIFFGILLSVASAILGLWLGGDRISAGESILIGLVGLGLSFQVDILVRLDRRDRFVALIDGPPWVAEQMAQVCGSLQLVNTSFPGSIVGAEAEQRLAAFSVDLDELAQGRVRTHADDARYLLAQTTRCRTSLVGVTNLQPKGDGTAWWRSELGRKYWQCNLDALQRGVSISRVFIVEDAEAVSLPLQRLVEEQCAAGAQVFVVSRDLVAHHHQRNIAVWDDAVAWEADMNAAGLAIENVYSHTRHDVERLRRIFEVLHVTARAQTAGAPSSPLTAVATADEAGQDEHAARVNG